MGNARQLLAILPLTLALACGDPRAEVVTSAAPPAEVSLATLLVTPSMPPEAASTVSPGPIAPSAPVPPAPAGMSPSELVDRAHALYEAGRLRDALTAYRQAEAADPDCAVCTSRIDRVQAELHSAIIANLDAGQRYHDELRTDEARRCWERVLLLDPDPTSPYHLRALGYVDP